MQLLGKGAFQFNKIKYHYLLETDGIQLNLRCEDLVEKTLKNLTEDSELKESLYNQIAKKFGRSTAINAIFNPQFISTETRREMSIPFPPNEEERLSILASELIREGLIQMEQEDTQLVSYMALKDVKLVGVTCNNIQYYCSNKEGIKALRIQLKLKAKDLQHALNDIERTDAILFNELDALSN